MKFEMKKFLSPIFLVPFLLLLDHVTARSKLRSSPLDPGVLLTGGFADTEALALALIGGALLRRIVRSSITNLQTIANPALASSQYAPYTNYAAMYGRGMPAMSSVSGMQSLTGLGGMSGLGGMGVYSGMRPTPYMPGPDPNVMAAQASMGMPQFAMPPPGFGPPMGPMGWGPGPGYGPPPPPDWGSSGGWGSAGPGWGSPGPGSWGAPPPPSNFYASGSSPGPSWATNSGWGDFFNPTPAGSFNSMNFSPFPSSSSWERSSSSSPFSSRSGSSSSSSLPSSGGSNMAFPVPASFLPLPQFTSIYGPQL